MEVSSRYIKNDFSDYKGKPINEGLYELIRRQIHNLLRILESNYKADNDFTVYTGTAGIAYMYLQLYLKMAGDPQRDTYLQKAKQLIEHSLKHKQGGNVTFLCGNGGPLALAAVIYKYLGKMDACKRCVAELLKMQKTVLERSSLPDELLYGRAGYLSCLLFLNHHVSHSVDPSLIQQVVDQVLERGQKFSRQRQHAWPLLYDWYDTIYLGAAHGFMGILYNVMASNSKQESLITSMLDHLLLLAFPSGNFPAALEPLPTDELVHWCHGAPGWVHTLIKASQLFNQPKYLDAAKACGKVVWERGLLKKGYGICHGVAGNAYTFLALYNATGDQKYLYQALKFAEFILDYGKHGCRTPDTPYSLFEGMAGTIYFLADMLDIPNAKFPAYEM